MVTVPTNRDVSPEESQSLCVLVKKAHSLTILNSYLTTADETACLGEHLHNQRDIGSLIPADNWAFSPALVEAVADAIDVLAAEGYLSPKPGNSYTYHPVSTADHGGRR